LQLETDCKHVVGKPGRRRSRVQSPNKAYGVITSFHPLQAFQISSQSRHTQKALRVYPLVGSPVNDSWRRDDALLPRVSASRPLLRIIAVPEPEDTDPVNTVRFEDRRDPDIHARIRKP
jgi:hypothetical protein